MAVIRPFRALRPALEVVSRVASVPYDVVSRDEARALAQDEPLSFLHVSRAEIDLPAGTDPYADEVYAKATDTFRSLRRRAPFVRDAEASFYIYRLTAHGQSQTGVAACWSLDEYDRGAIKKHEHTRRDKEDDRTRHMLALGAQTGLVFLTYRAVPAIAAIARRVCEAAPEVDFEAADGVRHTIWRAATGENGALMAAFAAVPALYIADGHHRVASAARARAELTATTPAAPGDAEGGVDTVLAVAFPHTEVRILPYNRIVTDLAGRSPAELRDAIAARCPVRAGAPAPSRAGEVSMYLDGRWHAVDLEAVEAAPAAGRADRLDVARLHAGIVGPLLGIGNVRQDPRIDFVGGACGPSPLQALVDCGRAAVAFSMYPVTVDDLMAVSDEGGIMPPKSTWFEPKLRDGLLIHLIA